MTFKELKKRISDSSNQQQQQTQSFDKLQKKPFWIWDIEEHKMEDVRTKGECCFNHIIGLPTKDKEDDNKETEEPDYDDDEKSDIEGKEKQEQETGQITINQVF